MRSPLLYPLTIDQIICCAIFHFLKKKEYVACQGVSATFMENNDNIYINNIEYCLDNLNHDDPWIELQAF